MLGATAESSGTIVLVAGKALNVAEACSGLKFMTTALFMALVIGRLLLEKHIAARFLLAAAGLVIAFGTNVARLVAAGFITESSGVDEAARFLHGPVVYVIYIAGAACLILAAIFLKNIFAEPLEIAEDVA